MQIADSDDRILTVERTKVSARAGFQRSGVPLQIADADECLLTIERTKVSARAGLQRSGVRTLTIERTKVSARGTAAICSAFADRWFR